MNQSTAEVQIEAGDWLFARTPRRRSDVLLEVGSGRYGPALAGDVAQIITVGDDVSALAASQRATAAAGITNITYLHGAAASLPFPDASFRVALCGCELHRSREPRREFAELRRVLERGGWLALADIVVSEDPDVAERQNRIEALADPRHTRALSASELQDTLVRVGYEVTGAETHEVCRPLETWLEQSLTRAGAAEQIRAALAHDAGGGEATGLRPRFAGDGSLTIAHTLTSLLVLNRDG